VLPGPSSYYLGGPTFFAPRTVSRSSVGTIRPITIGFRVLLLATRKKTKKDSLFCKTGLGELPAACQQGSDASRKRQRVRNARASIKSQVSIPRFSGLSAEASRVTWPASSLHPRQRRSPCCGRSRINSDGRRMTRLGHLWYPQTFSSPTAASRTPWWSDDRFEGCHAVPKGLLLVRALLGSKPVDFRRHDSPSPKRKTPQNTVFSMLFGLAGLAPEIFSQGNQLCLDLPLHRVRSGI